MYNHAEIDGKWQKKWEDLQTFRALDPSETDKPAYYCLVEFPFPSGAGLHVGHPRSYTALDVIARKRRAQGYNVLYPIGWDAFGLPTENYAIKTGRQPAEVTAENVATFKRQLKSIGLSFDWSREVDTTDPAYYEWTQWMFLEFFKAGLAYKATTAINWCPKDKIGLANEEVVNGCCERCGGPVEKRDKEQWMIAITKYADRLISDLDTVDYLPKVKKQQIDWIGRSEGAEIDFTIEGRDEKLTVFTTRPDTLFGVTFLAVSPDHPVLASIVPAANQAEVEAFCVAARQAQLLDVGTEDGSEKEKNGIFTGAYVLNPANNEKVPLWVGDYVLMNYGTGAVMGVPAHDERDFAFAKKYGVQIKPVIKAEGVQMISQDLASSHGAVSDISVVSECLTVDGVLANSGEFTGQTSEGARKNITTWLESKSLGRQRVTYRLRDWVFSRQRYWGEPIPLVRCASGCGAEHGGWVELPASELPLTLPAVEKYEPTDNGDSPLATVSEWVNTKCPQCGGPATRETDTMPNWAGSSWYFLRYIDPKNNDQFATLDKLKYWMPVDWYNGGMEHTTLHLLYSRFWNKFLFDRGYVTTAEPYMKRTSHGLIMSEDGTKMSKSKGNVVNPDDIIQEFGADTLRVYELFIGPFAEPVPWSTNGVIGVRRFLDRAIRLPELISETEPEAVTKSIHRTIKSIIDGVEDMKFNTAIAALMSCVNEIQSAKAVTKDSLTKLLSVFGWFAPHVANEVYAAIGSQNLVESLALPTIEEKFLTDDFITLSIQVNGKLRGTVEVAATAAEEEIIAAAKAQENVAKYLTGEIKKTIFVKGKMISFVV